MNEAEGNLSIFFLAGRLEPRGSSNYTLSLASELSRRGHSIMLITSGGHLIHETRDGQELNAGGSVHISSFPSRPYFSPISLVRLRREAKNRSPVLLHIQTQDLARAGRFLARYLDLPYIITIHSYPRSLPIKSPRLKGLISVSEAVREALVNRLKTPKELIQVIPNGVDVESFGTPASQKREGQIPVIGALGPLEKFKGHHFLIEAMKSILMRGYEAHCLIVGSGPEERNLRRQARNLLIEKNVTFVPQAAHFAQYFRAFDIFAMPSVREGLGISILESMAMGRPVVASGVGGVYQVVTDGETGLLVPKEDADALAEKIIYLLDNPEVGQQLAERAQTVVREKFSLGKMTDATEALYHRCLHA